MLGLAKEDVIGYYMLGVLNLENEFSLEEIQENSDSFLLDINEEEGIIARVNFSTIVQETGFVTGYIAVLHDVTEQQQVERERREFVANVSHELRTPLTSMNSYIEALEEGAWQDKELAPSFLSVTCEETERMIRLVNDLLQLSKMDNESIKLRKKLSTSICLSTKLLTVMKWQRKIQHSYAKFHSKPSLLKSIQTR